MRRDLLTLYRRDLDPELRFHAHILLLLGEKHSWDPIETKLFIWLPHHRPLARAVPSREGRRPDRQAVRRPFRLGLDWVALLVTWVTSKTSADFGFLRCRSFCALLELWLRERGGTTASRKTVRRLMHRGHLVYRRPRPLPPLNDQQRRIRLTELRALLEGLPADETVV
jgi:hypothetical protein